jgi:hypothetical protein
MPISRGDRFKLMCYLGKIQNEDQFIPAFRQQQVKDGEKQTNERSLRRRLREWQEGAAFRLTNEETFVATLKASGWPKEIPSPEDLLQKEESVPAFLELCKLSYSEVESFLSENAKLEWADRHFRLHFMKTLEERKAHPKAKILMPAMIGTYRLYRRHSVLPGVLREHFVISRYMDGHCEGEYVQFARNNSEPNIIPFNVFFGDFYVIAFGAHKAIGGRTEIVTVTALIENAFSGDRLLPCDQDNKYFIGLLSGIYDFGNILLSERVLIEKIGEKVEPNIRRGVWQPMHLRGDSGQRFHIEMRDGQKQQDAPQVRSYDYEKVIDAVDNSLDGQTLTARLSRIELVIK